MKFNVNNFCQFADSIFSGQMSSVWNPERFFLLPMWQGVCMYLGDYLDFKTYSRRRQDESHVKKITELRQKLTKGDYQKNYTGAKATGSCIICGGPAKEFRDAAAKLEYTISALCQICQDEYLNGR